MKILISWSLLSVILHKSPKEKSHLVMSNSLQPCWLYPPDSSVHGISQGKIVERVAIPSPRGSSWPRDQTWVSCIAGGLFSNQGSPHSNQKKCFKKIKIEHKVCKKIICKLLKDIPLLFLIFIKIVWEGHMEDLVLNIDLKEVLRFGWKSTKYVKRLSW